MAAPVPRSRTIKPLGVSRLVPVLALALSAASAEASEVICEGSMRLADCSLAGPTPWSTSSQPTFTARCKACPTPTVGDGGSSCGPWAPADQSQFRIHGPNTTPGLHPLDFERAGSCGDEALFRYRGPLVAGNYDIWLNANPHSYALRFTVAGQAPDGDAGSDAGSPDAGAGADVTSAGGGEVGASGCSSIAGRTGGSPLLLLLVAAIGAMVLRSRRRAS